MTLVWLYSNGCVQDWYIKLNDEDTVVVCTIIATAEYCMEVVGALGRSVAKTIDPPFGNKVCVSSHAVCAPLKPQPRLASPQNGMSCV